MQDKSNITNQSYQRGHKAATLELKHFSPAELLRDGGAAIEGGYGQGWADACKAAVNPVGRPKGSTKPDSQRRVSLTVKILPYVAQNIKKLPRGHLRKQLESLYG